MKETYLVLPGLAIVFWILWRAKNPKPKNPFDVKLKTASQKIKNGQFKEALPLVQEVFYFNGDGLKPTAAQYSKAQLLMRKIPYEFFSPKNQT